MFSDQVYCHNVNVVKSVLHGSDEYLYFINHECSHLLTINALSPYDEPCPEAHGSIFYTTNIKIDPSSYAEC